MKPTTKSAQGTSFHQHTFDASPFEITQLFGEAMYYGDPTEKTTREWHLEDSKGNVVTIYDWKEYREIQYDEIIEWHIGAKSNAVSFEALKYITSKL